jgi:hypothetical protein
MKNLFRVAVLIVIISAMSNQLMGQWIQTNGPEGGWIISFAVKDTSLFAGTFGGGIYRSTDNGTSWTEANGGLWNRVVPSLMLLHLR